MSILIKGVGMPKEMTAFVFDKRGKVSIFNGRGESRMVDAIEIPTQHGRLGDLDALKKKALIRSERRGRLVNVMDMVISAYDIETAPTIIEAEE